ncbi:MAG TPA: recombinase family protein [Streptosporangiaceae bacterium]|nr:recombinase family protein [Streptosporangiaceae bacterium]
MANPRSAADQHVHLPDGVPSGAEVHSLGRGGLSYWLVVNPQTYVPGGPVVAGGYARISRDEDKTLRGVGKQLEDDLERAGALGWTVARLYIDDDLTAAKYDVVRPAFEQLMADLAANVINAVVVWRSDRFTRLDYDLTRLFREHAFKKKQARHSGILFASKSALYDLDDPATHQRLTVEVSIIGTGEVHAMRERQTREHARKAAAGSPAGGRRGFGYQATPEALTELEAAKASGDRLRIDAANKRVWYELRYRQDPREAKALRDARDRVLTGTKISTIANEWNTTGLLTPLGRLWRPNMVKATLTSPRLAGYRIYRGEIALDRDGKPVFVAGQDPIFTVAEHEEIAAYLKSASGPNRPAPGQRRFLLTGLMRCGVCKGPMYGNVSAGYNKATKQHEKGQRRMYLCSGTATSCGKSAINADKAEAHIIELVARHIDQLTPETVTPGAPEWDRQADLDHAETQRAKWGDAIDAGEVPETYGFAKVTEWDTKVRELKRERQAWQRTTITTKGRILDSGKELRAMTGKPDLIDQQRAVIERYLTGVLVRKIKPQGPRFQPDRLLPIWLEQ